MLLELCAEYQCQTAPKSLRVWYHVAPLIAEHFRLPERLLSCGLRDSVPVEVVHFHYYKRCAPIEAA